jgi:hypothetical protein
VLAELSLERRVIDVLQHCLVSHRGIDVVVDEVQLDFQPHLLGAGGEAACGQHPSQRVQASSSLLPIALQILIGVDGIDRALTHPTLPASGVYSH